MAVRIIFTDDTELRVKYGAGAADLAVELSRAQGGPWAGRFFHMERTESSESVWVNPATIAYLEQWPD